MLRRRKSRYDSPSFLAIVELKITILRPQISSSKNNLTGNSRQYTLDLLTNIPSYFPIFMTTPKHLLTIFQGQNDEHLHSPSDFTGLASVLFVILVNRLMSIAFFTALFAVHSSKVFITSKFIN